MFRNAHLAGSRRSHDATLQHTSLPHGAETLIDQTLADTSKELRARLFSGLAQKPKAARALAALKRYLSAEHRDDPAHGCPFPAVAGEMASGQAHSDALAEQVEALARELGEQVPARLLVPPMTSRDIRRRAVERAHSRQDAGGQA
jgi:hypothetical protein